MVIDECDGSDHQVWELQPFETDRSLISVVAPSGLCVTVAGADAGPRTPLMLAQCDEMKSQGWLANDLARPARPRVAANAVGVSADAADEYYWYDGHQYCWYDIGWRGPGWYWCGYGLNNGIGWGGPIGWHFWYHFGHHILNHPVFFAAHHGQPAHLHVVAGIGTGKGNQGVQSLKGQKGEPGNKGNQSGKGEVHEQTKRGKGGKGNPGSATAKTEGTHRGSAGKNGPPGNVKIIAGGNLGGPSHGPIMSGGRHPSDVRLKEDIVPLARLDDGIGLYRFRYQGSDRTAYVGVLAQEVMQIVPAAVSSGRNGYLQVDYDRLGLKFMTWKTWLRRNGAELRPARE